MFAGGVASFQEERANPRKEMSTQHALTAGRAALEIVKWGEQRAVRGDSSAVLAAPTCTLQAALAELEKCRRRGDIV
ncbi:hypothetical protein Aduo_000960 [Ancylostoma duodenale]